MTALSMPERRFSVAPMLDYTDRHARFLYRLISKKSWLYTEMITTGAILHGDYERFLAYDKHEHPLVLQLGGSDPAELAKCCRIAEQYGYDEVNLNVGCPSDRVQSGKFGACLMLEPTLVANCVAEMKASVGIPISVKCRLGVDDQEDYHDLHKFVETVSGAGCNLFTIHARKAWLQGLSPKENRDVPPLKYELVYQIKQDFPELTIIINGGIASISAAKTHLTRVDGVMLGRAVYHDPYLLAEVDNTIYNAQSAVESREQILNVYLEYIEAQLLRGSKLTQLTRPLLGLFHAQPGARQWRRHISENSHLANAGIEVLVQAAKYLR